MNDDPYWNHNTHYHRWLVDRMPASAGTALDVGCGDGLLATKLARRCDSVLGIDVDAEVLTRTIAAPNITYERADFRDLPGSFDFVTAVAILHHVPLREGLAALRRLVAPGGTLAILGLWKMSLRGDPLYLPLIPAIRLVDLVHPAKADPAPMRDPQDTLHEIRCAAAEILPGARLRRRLMWRYTLIWRNEASDA
ncbi:class I SAM-dependent methyltransferase [Nocardia sp. NPDC050710]|uniref:class I SAM-dependent methyltransferase n=1 Tax=Nocardia sp. NPDC050710 TaxID=3157220 RepID=UPI0033FAF5B5